MLSVSSTFSGPTGTPPDDRQLAGGCAWLVAWLATGTFAVGAGLLFLLIVTDNVGAYGLNAVFALVLAGLGVALLAAAAFAWVVAWFHHGGAVPRRVVTALIVASAAGALVVSGADLIGWLPRTVERWPIISVGLTLLPLAAVLAAPGPERRPALAFAAAWLLLIGALGYRAWTDFDARVVTLGQALGDESRGVVGFTATRSGDFDVRYAATSCISGRVLASGRYEWRADRASSSHGKPQWVDLPSDLWPLQSGDLVRVCLRDGFAAATAAGEYGGKGGGFWPID